MMETEHMHKGQSEERIGSSDVGPSLIARMGDKSQSPTQKYQDIFVGERSIWSLIKYELLIASSSSIPGALGLLLRKLGYPMVMQQVGSGTVFGQGVRVRCPSRISLGSNVIIDDNVVLDAKGEPSTSRIELGDDVLIGRNGILSCTNAYINIGDHVSMGPNCYLTTKRFIEVGSNVSIGPYASLVGAGHSVTDPSKPALLQERTAQGVVVEDGVWLGARVTVLDGVRIGENAIVGAGAVVTEDIPPNVIAVGVPARVISGRE